MTPASPQPADDLRTGLRPPQFGLRTVWLGVTVFCVLLAAMKWLPAAVNIVLAILILSVLAHVLGNALGMQLRGSGNRPLPDQPLEGVPLRAAAPLASESFAPPSQLTERRPLGRLTYVFPALGAVTAATGGYFWLLAMLGRKATLGNVSFGVGAFLVIGGILGYLAGTFLKVLVAANVEAWRNGEPPS